MLFFVFCVVCLAGIGISYAVSRRRRTRAVGRSIQLGPIVLPEDRFYHPGHTWVKSTLSGEVLVGMDAFARRFFGAIRSIRPPSVGAKIDRGRSAWTVQFDGRLVDQPAPLSGRITGLNEEVLRNPDALREDPYEKGWILKIEPDDPHRSATDLFGADLARRWAEQAIEELQRTFSPAVGSVSQDGGELAEGVATLLEDQQWEKFRKKYFPVD